MASRAAICKQLIEEIKGYNGLNAGKVWRVMYDEERFEEICAQKKFSKEDHMFILDVVDRHRRNPGTKKMWIEGEMREVRVDYADTSVASTE